jgi:hypothetical protein
VAYHRQLVSELDITGGDKGKTGYYAGIIVRTFHFFKSRKKRETDSTYLGINVLLHRSSDSPLLG